MSNIDLAVLRRLYIDEQQSIRAIAARLHVNPHTVHNALIRGRIPRRTRWQQQATAGIARAVEQLDEARLHELYVIESRSIREIADIFNTCPATVQHALIRWNIPRRKRGRPNQRSREDYEQLSMAFQES